MRVLVTDISSYKAIVFARSLALKGVEVISADSRAYTKTIRTRYSARHYICPPASAAPERFLSGLIELVRAAKPDLLMPINSRELRICLKQRELFGSALRHFGSFEAFEQLDNKDKLRAIAEELGISCPRHYSLSEAALPLPLVFKPVQQSSSMGVEYLHTEDELAHVRMRAPPEGSYVLQQLVAGQGVGYSVLCKDGAVLAGCGHRRLAEIPISGGSSTVREGFSHPELPKIAAALVRRTAWTGLVMFEFKLAPDGRVYLIEANPRVWGSLRQAIEMGVDFPALLVLGERSSVQVPRTAITYLSPLHWLSLLQYALRKGDLRPLRAFLARWRQAVPDVGVLDDPRGYLSVMLRAGG
jgi:predicted ATP-grasp superfamily ATP-dependent carboligase